MPQHVRGHIRKGRPVRGYERTVTLKKIPDTTKDIRRKIHKNLVQQYGSELINYGGEAWTRADVMRDLQQKGVSQRYIDAYMMGARTLSEEETQMFPYGGL